MSPVIRGDAETDYDRGFFCYLIGADMPALRRSRSLQNPRSFSQHRMSTLPRREKVGFG